MAARTDIHASGMPDTPVEEVTDLLSQALRSSDAAEVKSLVQRARDIIGGLDPYMESVSSKPSQVCWQLSPACMLWRSPPVAMMLNLQVVDSLIRQSVEHDWAKAYDEVWKAVMLANFACNQSAMKTACCLFLIATSAGLCILCMGTALFPTQVCPRFLQKRTQFKQKKECCAGRLEGSFLRSLVRLTKAKTVLEVGMFTGTSSLAMAEALPTDGKVNPGCRVSAISHRLVSALAGAASQWPGLQAGVLQQHLICICLGPPALLGRQSPAHCI